MGILPVMSTQTIAVHLPDGAVRQVPAGATPLDIANSISPRLAAAAVVARLTPVDGNAGQNSARDPQSPDGQSEATMYSAADASAPRLVDLATPLTADSRLELLTEKDPEALKVVRHSAAHVLATAVLELFPETKLGHGPATDAGFFYDFYRPTPFVPEDLAAIEAKMKEVVARDEPFLHEFAPRDKSLEALARDGDFMKTHFVTRFTEPGSQVSFYRNGAFVDFCRGPHVPSTGRVKAFKVSLWPAPTGSATKRIPSFSASTAPPSSRRKISMPTSPASKKPPGATIACSAGSSTSSASRSWPARASSSGIPRAPSSAKSWKTGCARNASAAATSSSIPPTSPA